MNLIPIKKYFEKYRASDTGKEDKEFTYLNLDHVVTVREVIDDSLNDHYTLIGLSNGAQFNTRLSLSDLLNWTTKK